ncbi:hypothetical protein EAG_12130 [Camponotus floridanus]|uniref:Uncharacterized protein n=1 Tax=Camponotus floridanus TaxID=104421 RepID=E2B0G4_CAMFO|nr:hypothetical protein EAG_12130 [Camponotus floridanus]
MLLDGQHDRSMDNSSSTLVCGLSYQFPVRPAADVCTPSSLQQASVIQARSSANASVCKEVDRNPITAGQNPPSHPQRGRSDPVSRSGGKNSFSEQTTAKFVRPMPRTVGFAARRANRFGETARAIHGTTRGIRLALEHAQSVGDGSRTKNSGFQTSTTATRAASSSQRAGLNSSKPHRAYHKKRIRINSVHPAFSQLFASTLLSRFRPSSASCPANRLLNSK